MHLFAASGPAAARFNGIGNSPTSHGKKLLCIMVLQLHMRANNKKIVMCMSDFYWHLPFLL